MKSNGLMDRRVGKYVAYAWLFALVLLSVLPFASRAVYMDEPQFLHVAEAAIERDWRFPQDTDWIFFGLKYKNMASQTHLPAAEYYLAALLKVFGRFDEFRFRLLYSVFPLLAVFSFFRLARRFTVNPVIVASLFAASPAFFVMGPTLMMDIPMLAFFMAGLSFYFEALEDERRLWFCSLFFFLAIGTGYLMLGPVGGLLIWAIANRRPKKEWLAISAAPALLLVWLLILRVHFGSNPAADLLKYYIAHSSPTQLLLPLASFLGGVSIFPWLQFALTDIPRKGFIACGSILAAAFSTLFKSWPSYSYRLWFVFLAGSGIFFFALFIVTTLRRSGRNGPAGQSFLILWAASILSLLILFAEMISARYVLLVLPPLFLLTFDRAVGRRWAVISLAATVLLSLTIAVSDYQFVNSYPAWVSQYVLPLQRSGFRVWNATESGLRFYMEKTGSETLDAADLRPRGANLIVKQMSFDYGLANELGSLLLNISNSTLTSTLPIRTFSLEARAGFHDSRFGIVPYRISRAPFDRIAIAEVSPFVKDLPEVVPPDFSSVPVWFPGGVLLKQVEPEMNFHLQIPQATKLSYELEGMGSVAVFENSIILTKRNSGPAVWKNFRIVPRDWPD